ncbi:DinB family protein [Lewinella cohaerens]|uniref:DinB family protein n=1 Tax=Lewinella cohaerens TaxID=70995 RepID=UPI000377AD10|nr:DinB family protein [Lewinella cohaerens]
MTIANFEFILKSTQQTRANMLSLLKPLQLDELNKIPDGFRNNLVWNFGHVIVTQQLLCYGLSGLKPLVDQSMVEAYRKGSAPQGSVSQETFTEFIQLSEETLVKFQHDYAQGIFENFKLYPTSFGIELSRVEEAFQFNLAHEAMHLGTMMAMRKLV